MLTAKDGYISTPDGNSIYMWSYTSGSNGFQYPGPMLCVHEGDRVTVTLRNNLRVASSIVFPGIDSVEADGDPSQPDPANNTLTKAAPTGGSVTYSFTASRAGTFLYESGTNPEIQDLMGMVGALVVRPADGDNHAYDEARLPDNTVDPSVPLTRFNPGTEFLHLLSEIDPDMHQALEAGANSYDMTKYKARYFMINGRSFPDTIAPNGSEHLPTQPYGALVHVIPRSAASPDPALIRYVNAGPVSYPFHPHSNHERILGRDAQRFIDPNGSPTGTAVDQSQDAFAIVMPPGSTADALFTWVDGQGFNANGYSGDSGKMSVPIPFDLNRTDGEYWSGSPFLGSKGALVNGITEYNECGEYYHVAHSHALFEATNYGASMGGMLTMVRVDPPNAAGDGPRASCLKAGN